MVRHAAVSSIVALALLACVSACGSSRDPNAPTRPLPAWAGHQVEVFDDTIEPAAVGLDLDKGYMPRGDPMLRERAQLADAVVRVKVTTVTAKTDGPDSIYQLGMNTVEKMSGKNPPPPQFNLVIGKASESHGILRSFESRLVGKDFVAFVREFARADGERELHFHLAPDSKDVRAAVGDAVLLGEMK
jgi:hypothetical protein